MTLQQELPVNGDKPGAPGQPEPAALDRPLAPAPRFFVQAVLVGLLAGMLAVAFRGGLRVAEGWRADLFDWARGFGWPGLFFPAGIFALAVAGSVWLVRTCAPETPGSGIPHVEAVMHHGRDMPWFQVLWVKFVGGFLSIGAGLALGREGPTIQMGGALGQAVGEVSRDHPGHQRQLVGLGACAGLAAAFNAPLASVAFLFEELREKFTPGTCLAALLAATSADVLCQAVLGPQPIFQAHPLKPPSLTDLPLFLVLGILAGGLGVLFNRTLLRTMAAFDRLRLRVSDLVAGLAVGALVGLVGWFRPDVLGGGEHIAQRFLLEEVGVGAALSLFVLRFLLSPPSYAAGTPGGLFAPILAIGALVGFLFGLFDSASRPLLPHPDPSVYVLAGMAAFFVGTIRKAFTGILLIMEMTGAFALMVPFLVACLAAFVVATALRDPPIYDELLRRELEKRRTGD